MSFARPDVLIIGFLLLTANIGCHKRSTLEEAALRESEKIPVLLEVENHNWADVVIYPLVDGKRYRFLQVGAAKDVAREIPPERQGSMGQLRFAVHRIGSPDEHVTELVSLRTGRTIRLTLESDLERSSIAVV